jgi:hypothetical protein
MAQVVEHLPSKHKAPVLIQEKNQDNTFCVLAELF